MRKLMSILAAILLFAACQKPYQTTVELGVNHEKILLPSFEQGHCFITVFSNGSWTISVTEGSDWAKLGQSSGDGIDYVRLDYTENLTTTERNAKVVVKGQGKECEILITQPAE